MAENDLTTKMKEESQAVYAICTLFFQALEDLDWELLPKESGEFIGKIAEHWNSTGDLPNKDAMKILLELEYGSKYAVTAEVPPPDLKDSTEVEWPKMEKAQRGKRLLADFFKIPAHLEAMRNFSELWRPFRHRIDGRILLGLISKGQFPEWYWKPQSRRINFALKRMEKFVNVVKGSPSLYKPKEGEGAILLPPWLGKRLLAEFLQTPAQLEAVRNFSKLWRPYREMFDGELLMNFICKGYFPEEHWAAKEEAVRQGSLAA